MSASLCMAAAKDVKTRTNLVDAGEEGDLVEDCTAAEACMSS